MVSSGMFRLLFASLLCLHAHSLGWVQSVLKETYLQRPSRSSAAEWPWHLTSGPRKTWRRAKSSWSKSIPGPGESQSQLLDLPFVLLEHKVLLCSEKKYLSFKEQQGEHRAWSGLRAREIVGGKVGWAVRTLKAARRTWLFPLSEVRELALSRGGPDLIENRPSICCAENRGGEWGLQMEVVRRASWYRREMAMSSALMVGQAQEVVKFWVYFEDGQNLLTSWLWDVI